FWGFLHGFGLAVTRAYQRARGAAGVGLSGPWSLLGRGAAVLLTFHYVCFAWVFFRAPTFRQAVLVLKQIATLTRFHPNLPPIVLGILAVGLVTHFIPGRLYEGLRRGFTLLPAPAQGVLRFGVALVLHEAASAVAVPFVYFQF